MAVPINTRFRARELGYVIENAGLVALLTSDIVDEAVDFVQRLGEALPGLDGQSDPAALALPEAPRLRSLVLLGAREPDAFLSRARFDALGDAVSEQSVLDGRLRVRVRDIGLMLFTSGTTAAPKGCLLTHEAVVRIWCATARLFRIGEADRIWDALPMFHMSCLGPLIFTFELGATLISMTHFEPAAALAADRARARELAVHGVPADRHGARQAPGVRGHGPLGRPRADERRPAGHAVAHPGRVRARAPDGRPLRHDRVRGRDHLQRVGRHAPPAGRSPCGAPLPGVEVRVVDPETGAVLGPDARGELQIRGIGLFEGYHGDPEATAASFTDDGWLRSGDAGQIDADGMVIYLGRIKDMMKVGGENVAPAEIESHLSTHPAIKLVQVVAVPDLRLDEVPAAFIELVPGAS